MNDKFVLVAVRASKQRNPICKNTIYNDTKKNKYISRKTDMLKNTIKNLKKQ